MPVVTKPKDPTGHPVMANEELLQDIVKSILTVRSHESLAKSHDLSAWDSEVFHPLSEKGVEYMLGLTGSLYRQCVPLTVELKASNSSESVLVEQWTIRVSSSRASANNIPLSFLVQAVRSYLHFSQLRSWFVATSGKLPFTLLYRVCAPGDDPQDDTTDTHSFPTAALPTGDQSLEISVRSLPRSAHLPLSSSDLVHPLFKTTQQIHTLHSLPGRLKGESPGVSPRPVGEPPGQQGASPRVPNLEPLHAGKPSKCLSEDLETEALQNTNIQNVNEKESNCTVAIPTQAIGIPVSTASEAVRRKSKFAPGVTSSGGGSPVPWLNKRRSCAITVKYRPRPPVRSNSCPATVPSLSLLGTFEESVLNGRLTPCGRVEGFTAELGASGSFRPAHITLPVEAEYFSLHGSRGSPYLGHIDLGSVGRKGYRVPRKGTFQLTLFNPNGTVVKIFIVSYDLSDMPSLTQTFLRQRTLSKQPHTTVPSLHYLVHLRFRSTKTGHVYLSKNIKLLFTGSAPESASADPSLGVCLYTTLEGPTQPKYCTL